MVAARKTRKQPLHESLITAVAVGGLLIVVGTVFALNPNILQGISDFFSNITFEAFPPNSATSSIILPALANPSAHLDLYTALIQFDIGIGILQIIILALRIVFRSNTNKLSETVGDLIFWFGAAYLVSIFLQAGTLVGWFTYWATLIVLTGITMIVRAIVHFAKR